jgi:hypothetical protein
VNANPSGSRTSPTGSRGRAKARRVLVTATGPSPGHLQRAAVARNAGGLYRFAGVSIGGTQYAMMVCRGVLTVRRAAQGRVGDLELPRHIARHLVRHRLLSASRSALPDTVRLRFPGGAGPRRVKTWAVRNLASRVAALPRSGSSPRLEARDPELVQTRKVVGATPSCGQHRGKGVRAA